MAKTKKATPPQTPPQPRPSQRKDGWTNATTGIGMALKDKRLNTRFRTDLLSRDQLEAIWRGSDLAARIIDTVPDEMVREGFDLRIQPDDQGPSAEKEKPADPLAGEPGQAPAEEGQPGAEKPGEDPDPDAELLPGEDPDAEEEDPASADPDAPPAKPAPGAAPADPEEDPKKKKVDRADGGPDQPRDEIGRFGEGGAGGAKNSNAESGGASHQEIHPSAVKASTSGQLARRLKQIMATAGHNAAKPSEEYTRIGKELKKRKITTFAKLEVVIKGDAFGGPPGGKPFGGGGFGAPPPPKPPPGIIERPDDEPREQAEQVMAQCEELSVLEKFNEALKYERAYGGGAIFVGADDGLSPNQPLEMDKIKTVKWLNVLTPRELTPVQYYSDPQAPKYGEVEIYRIQRETMASPLSAVARVGGKTNEKAKPSDFSSVEVHESRLIIFGGIKVSRLQVMCNSAPGWGDSVLVRCNRVLADFDLAWASASILLQEFAPAVLKMQNLADLIANNEDAVVINRALALAMSKSTAGITLIDKEEEYERQTTPITGLDSMLDKFCTRLAAAADMPVTLLMGQAPAGLNATGASDIRFFYDKIKSKQKNRLAPQLKRLLKMMMLAKEGALKGKEPKNWSIEFRPLWQLTELEHADLRLKQAQVDKIEIDASVVTPEEVAASRHGGDQWSSKTTVDFEGREQMAVEHEQAMADHEKEKQEAIKNGPPDPSGGKPPPFGKKSAGPSAGPVPPGKPPVKP